MLGHPIDLMKRPVECLDETCFAGTGWPEKQDIHVIGHVIVVKFICVAVWEDLVRQNPLLDVFNLLLHDFLHGSRERHAVAEPVVRFILVLSNYLLFLVRRIYLELNFIKARVIFH